MALPVIVVLAACIVGLLVENARQTQELKDARNGAEQLDKTYRDLVERAAAGERIVFVDDAAELQPAIDALSRGVGGRVVLRGGRIMAYPGPKWMEHYRGKVWVVAMRQDDFTPRFWQATEEGLAYAREYVDRPGSKEER